MSKIDYTKLTYAEIKEGLKRQNTSNKTILNYLGKIKLYLALLKQREEITATAENINALFNSLKNQNTSDAVLHYARFALRSLFILTGDDEAMDYLNLVTKPDHPLLQYKAKILSVLKYHNEEKKYKSYKKELSPLLKALPHDNKLWTRQLIKEILPKVGRAKNGFSTASWYFFVLVLERPDLIADLDMRFTPPLPATVRDQWYEQVKKKTCSNVITRQYNRAAGFTYTWLKINSPEYPLTAQDKECIYNYVLSFTGKSSHHIVRKAIPMYLVVHFQEISE